MNFQEFLNQYQKVPVEHYPNKVSEKPLVSVCVMTYQHVNFIKECLDGILMQETNFDFEILLGEDASTDGTREICIEYAEKYPDRIKLFLHHRENNIAIGGSPTGRFNLVYNLFSAKGKYIALCEGDDYWTDPKKLQKQVDFLQKNDDYVISFHDCEVLDVENKIKKKSYLPIDRQKEKSQIELMSGSWLPTLTVLFRNLEILKNLPKSFYKVTNADTFLWSILGQYGKAYFDISISAVHIMHQNGVWGKKAALYKMKNRINTFFEMYNYHSNDDKVRLYIIRKINVKQKLLVKYNFRNFQFVNGIKESHKLLGVFFILFRLKINQ